MAREMKDSGLEWVGNIPENWEIKRNKTLFVEINERCERGNDYTLLSVSEYTGVTPRASVIKEGEYETHAETLDGYKICKAGDIVMNIMLAWKRATAASSYEGIISPAYCVYRGLEVDSKYYHYLFRTDNCADMFKRYSTGIIDSRLRLYPDVFLSLKSIVPPLSEQHRISSFLDTECARIDSVIEKTRASIEEYKKLKQAVITQAVTKGIRPGREMKDSGVEWIGEIVSDYQLVKLKHLLRHQLQYGANQSGVPYDELLPRYIRITDITLDGRLKGTGKLSLSEEDANDYILQDGDVLFARSGATVGKAFIYKKEYGRAAFAGYLIKATLNGELLPDLLFYYTQSSIYDEWKKQIFVQATIQNIGADRYRELPIILHPPEEQREIVSYLATKCSEIDSLIRKKEFLLNEFDSCKKSLIFEYVTGKKEVP